MCIRTAVTALAREFASIAGAQGQGQAPLTSTAPPLPYTLSRASRIVTALVRFRDPVTRTRTAIATSSPGGSWPLVVHFGGPPANGMGCASGR